MIEQLPESTATNPPLPVPVPDPLPTVHVSVTSGRAVGSAVHSVRVVWNVATQPFAAVGSDCSAACTPVTGVATFHENPLIDVTPAGICDAIETCVKVKPFP